MASNRMNRDYTDAQRAEHTALNVLEPQRLAAFEEAVAELRASEAFPLIGGPWSKLALVLEACQRNAPEAVPA